MPGDRLGVIVGSSVGPEDVVPSAGLVAVDVPGRTGAVGAVAARVDGSLAVIARHGVGAQRPAHLVDHVANLRALAALGCRRILALGSTGSLRGDWGLGTVVVPDDLFAPWSNPVWFDDLRAHAAPAFDPGWRRLVVEAWRASATAPVHDGGVYVQTRGPRFETPAEIRFYATVGDVVGMTVASEAILAQQAGLPYAALCVVDNLGNGLEPAPLSFAGFRRGVEANRAALVRDVRALLGRLAGVSP